MFPIHTLSVAKSALSDRTRIWIFSNEVEHLNKDLLQKTPVLLVRIAGTNRIGLYDRKHLIAVRLFERGFFESVFRDQSQKEALSEEDFISCFVEHFQKKLRQKREQGIINDQNAFRWIHGDADGIPNIIIDHYLEVLVAQSGGNAGDYLLPLCQKALERLVDLPLFERSTRQARQMAGLTEKVGWLSRGLSDTRVVTSHADLKMEFSLDCAQKTGLFLDQKENLLWLNRYLKNIPSTNSKSLLDICSYAGAWSAQGVKYGIRRVALIDQDKQALDVARQNIALQTNENVEVSLLHGDMFEKLNELINSKKAFDVVVADPPAFAKSAKHVPEARRAYARLTKLASKVVSENGILVICSCSRNMEEFEFLEVVTRNLDPQAKWGLLFKGLQSPDHTMLATDKYSHYLKCFVFVKMEFGDSR